MRALVTGATGFTGGHLARGLARAGADVRALVRDPAKAADLGRVGIIPDAKFMSTDFGQEIAEYGSIQPFVEAAAGDANLRNGHS